MSTEAPALKKTFQQLVAEAKTRIQEITLEELKTWQAESKNIVLLDVRETQDFQAGAIPGAISLPRGILELEVDEVITDINQTVVAYCGGGSRSALAADTLQEMGYTQVYSLKGGYRNYKP